MDFRWESISSDASVMRRRFSGWRDRQSVTTEKERLLRTLSSSKWDAVDQPAAYFYDPPWTLPFLRRNEVVVAVAAR